jgi:alditol oxidase
MDKRQFLKNSSAFVTGTFLSRFAAGEAQTPPRTNWSENYRYHAKNLEIPQTLEQLQQTVRKSTKLKALGSRHSFNAIADSPEDQVSLEHFNQMAIDPGYRTVTIGGGVTYDKLALYLDSLGYAVHNLASLTEITVAGAAATGTHGSGNQNGNLATSVAGMEIVTADGDVVTLTREHDGEQFLGAVVGLGGVGVVSKITLDIQPTFRMRQVVYENLPIDTLKDNLNDIFASGYSVSLFTDWQQHRIAQVWVKSLADPRRPRRIPAELFGAQAAKVKLHPIAGHPAESCTEQLGIPGPWYERLPHFRIGFTPSDGHELQTEYFVPREKGYEAILAVEELRDHITPHLFISELRTIAADNLWMSPCYQRDSMTIHFTWKPDWPAVREVLPLIESKLEAKLAPYQPRPHWAKLFTMPPSRLMPQYVKLPGYQALLKHYDPNGKFLNAFLNRNIYGA